MRRRRPCVRCGSRDRVEGMFICDTCLADSTKEDELRQATEFTKDLPFEERGKAQRKFLVQTFRWNGRW